MVPSWYRVGYTDLRCHDENRRLYFAMRKRLMSLTITLWMPALCSVALATPTSDIEETPKKNLSLQSLPKVHLPLIEGFDDQASYRQSITDHLKDLQNRANKMKLMKREGFKPGVSDLFIAVSRGTFHGMVLEMKDVNKKESAVTPDQADHLELMAQQGYYSCWAAGADIAIEQIKEYMALS